VGRSVATLAALRRGLTNQDTFDLEDGWPDFATLPEMATLSLFVRGVRSPRLRVVLVVLLLLAALSLALHLVGMADHATMMVGAYVVLLAASALLLQPRVEFMPIPVWIEEGAAVGPTPFVLARGRYPPDERTVLRD